jgi:isopentenyl diphosphate isomerase/L-lactate dehydrogenase-like FMN-dependent dehydrogenase
MGRRERDIRNSFLLPKNLTAKNFLQAGHADINLNSTGSSVKNYTDELFDKSFTWHDLEWLKSLTKLPIILKGIMHEEDAEMAATLGVAAIIVSNHGGRQLDSMPAAIEVLPAIAARIQKKIPVMIDGGFRRGTDIFKAIALGADCVLLGRPILWALAVEGEQGVINLFNIYRQELEETMVLCGCKNIQEIKIFGHSLLR